MRKAIIIFSVLTLITFSMVIPSEAFRCGCDSVSIGEHSFAISKKCGKPIHKETIIMGSNIPKLEHWIYGPKNGYYYCLVFFKGKLSKIESFKR